jgi:hypothetical protein
MIWLGLEFDTTAMTVSIPRDKLQDIRQQLQQWSHKKSASITQLRALLGKLLHIAQCCKPARLFLGRMLATLRQCSPTGHTPLPPAFQKDVQWFKKYLPATNGVYLLPAMERDTQHVWVDSSLQACGGLFAKQCYHAMFPPSILTTDAEICHLEMVNVLVALRIWQHQLKDKQVHVHSDSAVTVAVLQSGRGRDELLLTCAREIWLLCATSNIELQVSHTSGDSLQDTADALSRLHLGAPFQDRVARLVAERDLSFVEAPPSLFILDSDL